MEVSITGLGAVTALGSGAAALQCGLLKGVTGIRAQERFRSDPPFPVAAVDLASSLTEDRARFLAERAATEAIAHAGWSSERLKDERTMLVVATTKAGLNVAERVMEGRVRPEHAQQAFLFALAPRLARALGVGGPVHTVSLACASGLVAAGLARHAIATSEVDRAIVVGTDALCNFIFRGFASLQALDPEGARPFDGARAGLTVGEGAAAVTLERGPGLATLAGYGASNDANHITGPARDGRGLVAALRDSLAGAGVAPEAVGFAVLHGTGTRFNDAMEGVAYGRVFGPRTLPTLSIKGSIGHTMGAAGLANLVVAVRSLLDRQVPPSVGVLRVDPEIALDVVEGAPRPVSSPWAVTSASGFAGVNAAVVVVANGATDRRAPVAPIDTDRVVLTAQVDLQAERAPAIERIGARAARRLDDLCLFGVAAADAVLTRGGLSNEALASRRHGLVLGTALGCLESDHGFYARELTPGLYDPSPRLFAYTLPNIVLGETAIRHGLLGENLVLSAGRASGLAALVEAARRVRSGAWTTALVLVVDAVGPAARRLASPPPAAVASGWLLERASSARARGATMLGGIDGRRWSEPMADLVAPARVTPPEDGREPLGAAGLATLAGWVRTRTPGTVEVKCPSGYGVSVTLAALR